MTQLEFSAITIRPAYADDAMAIARLAALDSAPVPRGPLIVAEVDGELRVAASATEPTVIADPFHRTAELVALLRDHIERTRWATSPIKYNRRRAALQRLSIASILGHRFSSALAASNRTAGSGERLSLVGR